MKIVVNPKLKHPRVVVKDSGEAFLEVSPKDKKNKKLHKEIIELNKEWILSKTKEKEKNKPYPVVKDYEFVDGMTIFIMGKPYKLKIAKGKTVIEGNYLKVSKRDIKKKIMEFFIENYEEYIQSKVKEYSSILGIQVKVNLKNIKGISVIKKTISLNWKLLMFDSYLIDYIILKEMIMFKQKLGKNVNGELDKIMKDHKERENKVRIQREVIFRF